MTRRSTRAMPTHDVTIYSPTASGLFSAIGRAAGAQRQLTLLAGELARRGLRVALVVYPIPERRVAVESGITLVERPEHAGDGPVQAVREATRVLRALMKADGRVVVVRSGTPVVGLVALYCRLFRRRLIFAAANNLDFLDQWSRRTRIYAFGVRSADTVVVQSREQETLARRRFPHIRRLVRIPSFADEPPPTALRREASAFLWVGRLVDYKRPLLYADLAKALPDLRFVLIPLRPLYYAAERECLAQLEGLAARMPNFEVGESLPHAELVEALAGAVAVVNTALHEGVPNTFLEAWSQGVPVLTLSFDPDGVVQEQGLGVSANGSWERFVAGARELWEGRLDRDDLALRARNHVRDVHSRERVGAQWHALVEGVASSGADRVSAQAASTSDQGDST